MKSNRRTFLKQLSVTALALPFIRINETRLSFKITNAKVYYGQKWQVMDVGINEYGRIVLQNTAQPAEQTLDAQGKVLAPGFIDILADNSANPEQTYFTFEKYKITDGVTTALQMHGGHHQTAQYYTTFEPKKTLHQLWNFH